MRKRISILISAMCIMSLTACGSANKTLLPEKTESSEVVEIEETVLTPDTEVERDTEGWEVSNDMEINSDLQKIFDRATETLCGISYTPIKYLGYKESDMSYAYLCLTNPSVNELETKPYWSTVYIKEENDGECVIIASEVIDLAKSSDKLSVQTIDDIPDGNLVGGWEVPEYEQGKEDEIPDDVMAAYNDAYGKIDSVKYEPVMVLGEQVVAGMNYAILCRSGMVSHSNPSDFRVVYIYRNTKNEGEFLNEARFDIGIKK